MTDSEGSVWKLRQGNKKCRYNLAVFDPGYVTRPGGKMEKPAAMAPLFSDTDYCLRPIYMWKEREPEVYTDDEEDESKSKEKVGHNDRPKPKGIRSRSRKVQWHIEDARSPPKNMQLVGDKVDQQSKYVLFEVQEHEDEAIIKVVPVEEWWNFKKPPPVGNKISVKEAMEKMQQQQRGYAVVSGNKNLEAKLKASEDDKFADAEEEMDFGHVGKSSRKSSSIKSKPKDGDGDDAGRRVLVTTTRGNKTSRDKDDDEKGIDYDQVFSDDEQDIEDVYNAEVGLETSDDEADEVKEGEAPGQNLLKKALDGTQGGEEDEDNEGAEGYPEAKSRISPGASAEAETEVESVKPAKRALLATLDQVEIKRPKSTSLSDLPSLTQENMITVLKRSGGKMTSRKLVNAFKHELQNSKENQQLFKQLLQTLVTAVDDALEGKVYKLRDIFTS